MKQLQDVSRRRLNSLSFLWLEVTSKCNLSCVHCYADSGPFLPLFGAMNLPDWSRVITEAYDLGCKSLQFIGGEPTLHPHLDHMIEFAKLKGFEFIEVFTNATRLSPSRLAFFKENQVNIACSFYSSQASVHESITRVRGSFLKTVSTIQKMIDTGLSIRVGIIEMEQNKGQVIETKNFLWSMGIHNIGTDRSRNIGRGDRFHSINRALAEQDICGACWKGKLCVTASGDIYPCIMARNTLVGNAKEQSLAAILASQQLQSFRQTVRDSFFPAKLGNQVNDITACSPPCNPDNTEDCVPDYCKPDLSCSPDMKSCKPDDNACRPSDHCNPDDNNCYPESSCYPDSNCKPNAKK